MVKVIHCYPALTADEKERNFIRKWISTGISHNLPYWMIAPVMHDSGYISIPVPIPIPGKFKSLIPILIPIPARKKSTDSIPIPIPALKIWFRFRFWFQLVNTSPWYWIVIRSRMWPDLKFLIPIPIPIPRPNSLIPIPVPFEISDSDSGSNSSKNSAESILIPESESYITDCPVVNFCFLEMKFAEPMGTFLLNENRFLLIAQASHNPLNPKMRKPAFGVVKIVILKQPEPHPPDPLSILVFFFLWQVILLLTDTLIFLWSTGTEIFYFPMRIRPGCLAQP